MGLFGSKGNKSSGSNSSTPGFVDELGATLKPLVGNLQGFTKQDAITDVQGLLRTQAETALRDVMPSIAGAERQAGAYNSTSTQLLRDNAQAQIIGQLASTELDAIAKYAEITQSNVNAASNATKANTSVTGSNKSSGGGSGLLGLFADGGEVPKPEGDSSSQVRDILSMVQQAVVKPQAFEQDMLSKAITSITPALQSAGINTSNMQQAASSNPSDPLTSMLDTAIVDTAMGFFGFKEGGQVPPGGDTKMLLEAIRKYKQGGTVRTGESDVKAGGKIRGPQTKSGEDNQLIAVGGGEGIIAADVMEVPGVAQVVKLLNETYHKK